MANYKELRGKIVIVGAGESNEIGSVPNKSVIQLQAEAVKNAVRDAGLSRDDIDGVMTATTGLHTLAGTGALNISEYMGLKPRYLDATAVGGSSFIVQIEHAAQALYHGMCNYVVISSAESGRHRIGMPPPEHHPSSPAGQFEMPYGIFGPPTTFTMPAMRYLHTYGITRERLAEVSVSTRAWAHLNERARYRDLITVDDVLNARMIAYPMTLLMCCMVSDAGGAVVLTTADRAQHLPKPPVYVLGTGEAVSHQMVSQMEDYTFSTAEYISGERAFDMAGLTPQDMDFAQFLDAFAHTPLFALEALGFAKRGEGIHYFEEGRAAPGGVFPIDTNGGSLSYTHPGMYGIYMVIEGVRQLRGGLGPRQTFHKHDRTQNAKVGIVHGAGLLFSSAGTAILGNEVV